MSNNKNNGDVVTLKSLGVDTCFLISLVNKNDVFHKNANDYFKWLLQNGVELYLSSVVLSEFMEHQNHLEIIQNFKLLTFTQHDARHLCDHLSSAVKTDCKGIEKCCVRDDYKIISCYAENSVEAIISSDVNYLKKAEELGLKKLDYKIDLNTYLGKLPLPVSSVE